MQTTENGVRFDSRQVRVHSFNGFEIDKTNDNEIFTAGNSYNVHWQHRFDRLKDTADVGELTFEIFPAEFAKLVEHDTVDESLFPMILYKQAGKLVAWYDAERFCGYISD